MKMNTQGKGNDIFRTPNFLYEDLASIFNFTVDVACTSLDTKHSNGFFFDKGIDGLKQSWRGHRVFCNPPFSEKIEWIKKASEEVDKNECKICVMILPSNSMSSSIWFDKIYGKYLFEIVEKRIAFLDENNKPVSGNNSGTVIVYFKKKQRNK